MTPGLLQIGLLLWASFAMLTAASIALATPSLRPALRNLAPGLRANVLRALLVAPVVGGASATFLCFLPKMVGLVAPQLDHCVAHGDHHVHFCPNHPPDALFGAAFWIVAGSLALVVGATLVRRASRLRRARIEANALMRTADRDGARDVWVLPTGDPVALSVGFGDRRTLVSTGLLDRLDDAALDVILAHEDAHRVRRDGLWRAVTGLLSWTHWPAVARRLEAELEVACEQACDERAAQVVGDRLSVAATILAVARLRTHDGAAHPALLAFGASQLDDRVRALVEDDRRIGLRPGVAPLLVSATVLSALLLADPLHHVFETLLHVIAG